MGHHKAQISMEYMIIIGFVIFAILVPAFLILFSSTNNSVSSSVNTQKINDLGKGLTDDAKKMYYLGIYSKETSKYEVPVNVKDMFVLRINDLNRDYYYFGVYVDDGRNPKVYTFLSDVPLTSDLSDNNVKLDSAHTLFSLVKECTLPDYTCDFYNFTNTTTKPGMKNFKIETVLTSDGVKSSIVPVLQ